MGSRADLIREQRTFTDGRIVVAGGRARRRPGKRADFLLCYRPDFTIAVVEAKAFYRSPADGMQQAKAYAETLGLKFAYATNGEGILEFDFITGTEREISEFPTPEELWRRLRAAENLTDDITERLLTPTYHLSGRQLRYYQEIAVNRTIQSVLQGQRRILLTMATGTGKTVVAFQICWKLSEARWNRTGEYRRPRILYLADRNILIDDPKTRRSRRSAMLVGRSRARRSRAGRCISPSTRRSHATSGARGCTAIIRPISST